MLVQDHSYEYFNLVLWGNGTILQAEIVLRYLSGWRWHIFHLYLVLTKTAFIHGISLYVFRKENLFSEEEIRFRVKELLLEHRVWQKLKKIHMFFSNNRVQLWSALWMFYLNKLSFILWGNGENWSTYKNKCTYLRH